MDSYPRGNARGQNEHKIEEQRRRINETTSGLLWKLDFVLLFTTSSQILFHAAIGYAALLRYSM